MCPLSLTKMAQPEYQVLSNQFCSVVQFSYFINGLQSYLSEIQHLSLVN